MKVKITKVHRSNYPNPICFRRGQQVEVGEEDPNFPGWIRVKTEDGNEGWAPMDYLELAPSGEQGKAVNDYTAKELDVRPGEQVEIISELAGWVWCRSSLGEYGWIPAVTTAPAD